MYNGSDTRFDSLLVGCLLASAPVLSPFAAKLWPAAAAFLAAVALSLPYTELAWPAGLFTLTALAAASIVSALVANEENVLQKILQFRPLVALGEFSYGFYLWHYVFIEIARQGNYTRQVVAAISLPLTLVVSWASFRYVEKRIRPKPASQIAATADQAMKRTPSSA
jgi:peptidoglycan/LPS O-acetylase OafA/YrhL